MIEINETIAAIVTPLGESGVGVIRISGPEAFSVGDAIFQSNVATPLKMRQDRSIQYGHIVHTDGTIIDEVLLLLMQGPHSYTAEDVVEIQCHGNRYVLQHILNLVLANGARLARPGEFTQRAFLHGRIDLVQAEAVMDIIQAKSSRGLTCAEEQLEGRLSKTIQEVRVALTDFITRLEVMVDYPEEDLEEIEVKDISAALQNIQVLLAEMLKKSQTGKCIRDGILVAINGVPNVGKSSLLNCLLEEERAIVTDVPGTTRDVIEEWITIQGIPVCLVDTAGIRQTEDKVEQIGVLKAQAYMDKADIILIVLDSSRSLSHEERDLLMQQQQKPCVVILNKTDLVPVIEADDIAVYGLPIISISAGQGTGISELKQKILDMIMDAGLQGERSVLLANTRHIDLTRQAKLSIDRALETVHAGLPLDLAIIDIRAAWEALGAITGQTVGEDIITEIFSRFCLGK